MNMLGKPIPDLFVQSLPRFVQSRNTQYCYPSMFSEIDLEHITIDAISAAEKYPHHYSLIAVDGKDEYGTSYGRLLFCKSSLAEIDWLVLIHGGFEDESLCYVTGAECQ
ncbi:MAG: hypothetical protein FWF78_08010 [Defluviitaleaceae bacterium]|nr:hypothetical protein [Defluviitaleaceae bacterium]